jgi:hypothetical protein
MVLSAFLWGRRDADRTNVGIINYVGGGLRDFVKVIVKLKRGEIQF